MSKGESIMQTEKACYKTGRTYGLHKHHIFFGPNRKKSEEYGCWIWLIPELHNTSDQGIHHNRDFDLKVKKECQEKFEEKYSHELFMKEFGRNYL